jgi:hypothetical protein
MTFTAAGRISRRLARAPDLAHAAPADLLLEQILPQLARLGGLPPEPVQDP